jgi:hypothetical protein
MGTGGASRFLVDLSGAPFYREAEGILLGREGPGARIRGAGRGRSGADLGAMRGRALGALEVMPYPVFLRERFE